MADSGTATLQEVFDFIRTFYRQTRLMIVDAAELLRKETNCLYEHQASWDYARRPNEHFLLSGSIGCFTEAWVTYVPKGCDYLAALFYLQFVDDVPMTPSLMFGSLKPDTTIEDITRWDSFNIIDKAREDDSSYQVTSEPPFIRINRTKAERFSEAVLVRIPIELITGTEALETHVVKPLAALVRGDVASARQMLASTPVLEWEGNVHDDDSEDEQEQV